MRSPTLPVQLPAKVLNLKTAKALGLAVRPEAVSQHTQG
jgi:hypothetical protein